MTVLHLPGVTLACADTRHHALAVRALARSCEQVRFARVLWFTAGEPPGLAVPAPIERIPISPLASRDDYSTFVLRSLADHVQTPHVLVAQWDGHVVEPAAWRDAFLGCDYLGARWPWFGDGHDVGNGGFSLRSSRLLRALADPSFRAEGAEDEAICRTFRPRLEAEFGIRFGSAPLADAFSFEATLPTGRPFGFHGLFNFCRVLPQAELAALAPSFTADIAASPQYAQLLRNCVALGQWSAAIALASRMRELGLSTGESDGFLAQAERSLARGAGVGRNDACPCGSGRRYKACHGALGVASQTARAPQAPASSPGTPASPAANAPNADALVQRGIDAHRRGALEQAAADYRAALAIVPRHPYALHYLGVIDYQQGRPAQALAALEQSVLAQPREAEFHNNLGLALAALDRDEEAAATFRHALALRPGHAGAWNNLGLALRARNRIDEAIDAFRHALELAPAFTEARWNIALALLSAGRFEEGWEAYEARLSVPAFAPRERPATPRWDGRDPGGRTLLLVAEQGLGDAIHFARFARDLAAQGARVLLRAPGSLANLLQTAPGVAAVSPVDTPWPAHDAWLPLLSLGRTLKVRSVPAHEVPYLRADAGLRSAVRARLGAAEGTRRIGIAWAGNPGNTNDRRRSIALERLAPLFALPGIAWYSLQKDDASLPPAAVDRVHAGLVRLPWRNDFDGLAAMVDELDLVVSVDTSVAHLAGALGRPALVLLPFAGDWRWGLAGERTAWYPTLRLFRQAAPGDWTGAIDAVAAVLATPGAKPSRAG